MGLSKRIDKLEETHGPEPCPECGGHIVLMEVDSDGEWIGGDKPCPACDSMPPEGSGRVQRFEVVRGLLSPRCSENGPALDV